MASEKGNSGICAHCGAEVADDGFAVKMAEGGETAADEAAPEEEPDSGSSGFFEALKRRRPSRMGPELMSSEEG
jgi:hypothetical protein